MRLSRTIYMEKKRLKTQKSSENELKPIEQVTKMADDYLEHMKLLEREMI